MNNKPFAEIIESSLQHWLAQSWQWNDFPHFGSLITITTKNHTLYGIVHNVRTGSMDPVRYPFAYKKSHEELQREQPQIFEFLKTTFTALPLGYAHNSTITYQLPPQPPPIHTFVTHASTDECRRFFADASYLHVLFGLSGSIQNIDELLLALFTHIILK